EEQWARDTVSQFLQDLCVAEVGGRSPYRLEGVQETILDILRALTRGPSRSYVLKKEDEEDPRQTDYLMYAINSPRGKAVEALLKCARWIANQKKIGEPGKEIVPNGFDSMPAVREMLDWQIEPPNG